MTLEDLLREAAAKGLTHLTLYPIDSVDGKTVYWNARATPSTTHSYVQAANYDPVVAVTTVLDALPRAQRRKSPSARVEKFDSMNPPLSEMAQREVTAAVNPGDPVDLHDGPNSEWERFK